MKRKIGCIDGKGCGVCMVDDVPELKSGQIQVDVAASLISPGTELGRCDHLRKTPDLNLAIKPIGYANAGIITRIGPNVKDLKIGQRVACMGAGYALHADKVVVPQNLSVLIPDEVSFEEAAIAHLAATALHALRRTVPIYGEYGMVVGLGLVGQLCLQFGLLSGCHMAGMDKIGLRTEKAVEGGAERVIIAGQEDSTKAISDWSRGYGLDFGIIAFGGDANTAFDNTYQAMKKTPDGHHMGRITVVGGAQISHSFGAGLGNVDIRSAARTGPGYHDESYEHGRDYPRVFVEWDTRRNLSECLGSICSGKLKVSHLYTHEFTLEEFDKAVDVLVENPDEALGVLIKP